MSKIQVQECSFGKGVFARSLIHQGDEILQFSGPLIDTQEAISKGERQCNPLQIGKYLYMDIEPPGVLVNHSCEPNAGIRDNVRLVAIVDIQAGEEIFYDYSTTMDEDNWVLECLCGNENCRMTVGDFKYLPIYTRLKYLCFGIVQDYIATRRLTL